jgi:hypothetical protein
MKTLLALMASLLLAVSPVRATDQKKPDPVAPAAEKKLNASQQRMVDCNKEAGDKKGDARKAFMRKCMHGDKAGGGSQQARMTTCNQQAGDRKGDERKAFMSECLKKK